jgi:D-aminoacyl-tRNA deacylase
VSQFTLLASTKKGSKPDFHGAMGGDDAKLLYQKFFQKVKDGYMADRVKDGVFQAMMEVSLVNDGPVSTQLRASYNKGLLHAHPNQVTLELNATPSALKQTNSAASQ